MKIHLPDRLYVMAYGHNLNRLIHAEKLYIYIVSLTVSS
jgi:hypothetical protein